jgi:hypothetical protein
MPDHPDPSLLWRHRRRGFYLGIHGVWVQTLMWVWIAFQSTEAIQALSVVVSFAYGACFTLILVYGANTAVEEWAKRGAK